MQRLLTEAKRFDRDALIEIYDLFQAELYRYAYRQLGDAFQAEECVAETFSRFLKALRAGRGPNEHLRAYLFRIAHNWITDQYRRKPPPEVELEFAEVVDENGSVEEQVKRNLEQRAARNALALLNPEQRQVIGLKYLEDWNNQEVAEAIGKSIGAVKALQHRGLASLRRILETGHEADDER